MTQSLHTSMLVKYYQLHRHVMYCDYTWHTIVITWQDTTVYACVNCLPIIGNFILVISTLITLHGNATKPILHFCIFYNLVLVSTQQFV